MKKSFFLIFVILMIAIQVNAQVGINSDGSEPDPSSMLDVKSHDRGFLPPRVSLTSINQAFPVTSPAIGLLVYNTATAGMSPDNVVPGYYCWNGIRWNQVSLPGGTTLGDMLYWNGKQYVEINAGLPGQLLGMTTGMIPAWIGPTVPSVSTRSPYDATTSTVMSGGTIISSGGALISSKGLVISILPNPTTSSTVFLAGSDTGSFNVHLTGLMAATTYYLRAFAVNEAGTAYGNEFSFSTQVNPTVPVLTTAEVTGITASSASCGGEITDGGGALVTQRGVCWSTFPNPTINSFKTSDGSGTGSYSSQLTGLEPNTLYYLRAYATNIAGTGYGNTITLLTECNVNVTPGLTIAASMDTCCTGTLVTYTANPVNGGANPMFRWNVNGTIRQNSASTTFSFIPQNNEIVTCTMISSHHCRSMDSISSNQVMAHVIPLISVSVSIFASKNPFPAGSQVTFEAVGKNGGTSPEYQWKINNVQYSDDSIITYHPAGGDLIQCSFGSGEQCTTVNPAMSNLITMVVADTTAPMVITANPFEVTLNSAKSGGTVTSAMPVFFRGVCWSTHPDPTLSDNYTADGTGAGSFSSNLNGLISNTVYYLRAYAVNASGTYFGNQLMFTIGLMVSTLPVSDITQTSVIGGGEITVGGNAQVTERGFCWSVIPNPTIDDYRMSFGSGAGMFTGQITALPSGISWYLKAWAKNAAGVYYGNQVTFNTLPSFASITTQPVTMITTNSANSGGSVTLTNGGVVTARGICWSTNPGPTLAGRHTSDGSGSGTFTSHMDSLNPATTYYIRAYAVSASGIGYGNEISFTTASSVTLPVVTTNILTNQSPPSPLGGTVLSDGGSPVLFRGICWGTSPNPDLSGNHTVDGSGLGNFTSTINGTNAFTTYDVRAYAMNNTGTSYGDNVTFMSNKFVIGTGTTETGYPFYTYYMGSRTQMLYLASEIMATGSPSSFTITKLGFDITSYSSQIMTGFTIKMGHTSLSALTGWATTGMTTVYQGNYAITSSGIVDIPLSTQFIWNGTSNILVEVCFGNNGSYTSNSNVKGTNATGRVWHNHADNYAGCSGTAVGAVQSLLPNLYISGETSSVNNQAGITISSSASQICPGTQVSFTAFPVNGGTMPVYQWEKNGIAISGATESTYTYTPADNDTVTCILYSSSPNVTGNPATSNPLIITYLQITPAAVTISASSNPVCSGTSVTFTAIPSNGGTSPTFQWKKNGTNISGATASTYTYTSANGDVIQCVMTSNLTCVTGNPATSNPITMTVNSLLPVSVSIAASANNICSGTSVTFTAIPTNGGTNPSYQWKKNGTVVSGATGSAYNYIPANGDVLACVLSSSSTCTSGNPATSNSVTMIVGQLPVSVSIAVSANPVCTGTSVTFTATPTNGGTSPVYQWKKGGTEITGATAATYQYIPTAYDVITCILTSNVSCPTGNPATSNAVTMGLNPLSPVSVNITASAGVVCAGTSVVFTAVPSNGGTTPAYQWKKNGTAISGANAVTYSYVPANGDVITCMLTSNATCPTGNPATSNSLAITVNPKVQPSVTIFPSFNPFISGNGVTFNALDINGGAGPAHQWKLNGVNAGTDSVGFTYIPSAGDSVRCILTSNLTCLLSNNVTSNTILMTQAAATSPTLSTLAPSGITLNSVNCGGEVLSQGGSTVIYRGVCWSTNPDPSLLSSYTTNGGGTGAFTSQITGLSANTRYFYKAYAANNSSTGYGNQKTFVTLAALTTNAVSGITQVSAVCGGSIQAGGGIYVSSRGVCWNLTGSPTLADPHTSDGTGTGSFSSSLTGLTGNTVYYVRSYAVNESGVSYGDAKTFTTSPVMATLSTTPVTYITTNSVQTGGNITSAGGSTVTDRGVCWSTSPNPTLANSKTTSGSGTGVFVVTVTNLTPNTTYYLRSYATNAVGTSYGNELTFNTLTNPIVPTVTTSPVSGFTSTSITSGGTVLSDGGANVTIRGICYGLNPNPTIADAYTTDGTGTGIFASTATGLIPNSVYYLRAYAMNSVGVAYGEEVTFNIGIYVGNTYQGGIIFYVDNTMQHGLIAAPVDQSAGAPWGCYGTNIGTSTALGSGAANTLTILNACPEPGIAARICNDLVYNGYDDWYLPSQNEMNLLWSQWNANNSFGGFSNGYYWTSSNYSTSYAYYWSFTGQYSWGADPKTDAHFVRAIRSF